MINEFEKCKSDIIHFAKNYICINDYDGSKLKVDSYVEKILNCFASKQSYIISLPRQVGKSTLLVVYVLWKILFHNANIAVCLLRTQAKYQFYNILKTMVLHLPVEFRSICDKLNILKCITNNVTRNDRISLFTQKTTAIRGKSFDEIIFDEFAYFTDGKKIFNEFLSCLYSVNKKTKYIMISTNNPGSYFDYCFNNSKEHKYNATFVKKRIKRWCQIGYWL